MLGGPCTTSLDCFDDQVCGEEGYCVDPISDDTAPIVDKEGLIKDDASLPGEDTDILSDDDGTVDPETDVVPTDDGVSPTDDAADTDVVTTDEDLLLGDEDALLADGDTLLVEEDTVTDSDTPAPVCGNTVVDAGEACDDGVNDGAYGGCMPGCLTRAPYCGDSVIDPLIEGFESGNFPVGAEQGSIAWEVTTSDKHAGTYAIRSKSGLSGSSTSEVTLTLRTDTQLCFYLKGTSEDGYDFFRVYLDGSTTPSFSTSGTSAYANWAQVCISGLTAGVHSVTFHYYKDSSADAGLDAYWIDDIVTAERCDDGALNGGTKFGDCNANCTATVGCEILATTIAGASVTWQYNATTAHCYAVVPTTRSFADAISACAAIDPGAPNASAAHLVTLSDEAERLWVGGQSSYFDMWVGFSDDGTQVTGASEGNWRWLGEPSNTYGQYTSSWPQPPWKSGEPNNSDGVENCAEMYKASDSYRLNDVTCGTANYFACEWEPI
ncbi:MAG TPA: lectin-like protein [bacterium]|nr:lectin-like protein [bacterium]